jgi:hypothetical protein
MYDLLDIIHKSETVNQTRSAHCKDFLPKYPVGKPFYKLHEIIEALYCIWQELTQTSSFFDITIYPVV